MATNTTKKPTGIAVDVDLHAKVKSVASLKGISLERAYDEALRQWAGSAEPAPGVLPRNVKYHDMLEDILSRPEVDPRVSDVVKETVGVLRQLLEIHAPGLRRRK